MPPLRNVYYPYIYIELASGFSLTKSFKDGRPDYFTSLTHIRYVDKANTTTINLSYVPLDNDPNRLEEEIANSKGLVKFRYGYLGQTSREYRGLIYDYSVSISDGVLMYTLQIISQAVLANYVILSDLTEEELNEERSKTPEVDWVNAYKGSGSVKSMFGVLPQYENYEKLKKKPDDWETKWNTYYKKNDDGSFSQIKESTDNRVSGKAYTITDKDDANSICNKFENLVKDTLGEYYTFHKTASLSALSGLSSVTAKEQSCNGMSPISYMQEVLRGLVDKSNIDKEGNITDPKTIMFKLTINDSTKDDTKGEIYISKVDSTKADASYTFTWGTRNSDIISWDPQYKGSYSIFKARGVNSVNMQTKNVSTNPDGTMAGYMVDAAAMRDNSNYSSYGVNSEGIKEAFPYNTPGDDDFISNVVNDIETFRENADYCYTATLKVLGVAGTTADELRLCESSIQVTPYVNGIEHHSGGRYVIKGITDEVDSNGFTTKFDLYRCSKNDKSS